MDARDSLGERLPWQFYVGVSLLVVWTIVMVWLGAIHGGLGYDEIWTLREYAHAPSIGRIFSDMALANNHPLNSLLVRLTPRSWATRNWPFVYRLLSPGHCCLSVCRSLFTV